MAIKELFYDQRPVALLNPRASQRIDPRFKFTRNSAATTVSKDGFITEVPVNQPRLYYDPATGAAKGLLLEPQRSNFHTTQGTDTGIVTPAGTTDKLFLMNWIESSHTARRKRVQFNFNIVADTDYTASVYVKPIGQIADTTYLVGSGMQANDHSNTSEAILAIQFVTYSGSTGMDGNIKVPLVVEESRDGWYRISTSWRSTGSGLGFIYWYPAFTNTVTVDLNTGFYCWGFQMENGNNASSLISLSGAALTRSADLLSIESVIPSSASVFVDARAINTAVDSTLLSLKNASNQKINLAMEQRSELYNSLALTYSIKGTVKPTLPYPVPTTNRERNIITWGTQNYQYNTDGARFAPSLSTTPGIPANLTQLSIGHDAVDPTKAFNGYINAVYLYNGEITPTVAEALVRGELDPINADTYSPVGPTGSLALIINTQGASSTGDKVFALPAESALNDNDIVITWGDGTESGLDGAAAELGAAGLSHTYPSAGIYPIWVEGKLENLQFNNSASANDLVKIEKWGTTANGNDVFLSPSTMNSAFYGCSKLTSMPSSGLPDTSAVTSWYRAFRGCSSLTGTFPSFNFSAATTFQEAFQDCSSLTSFTAAGDQTQNVESFVGAWSGCSGLTSFPLINTSSGTTFQSAWFSCSGLTSFPLINTASATNLSDAWHSCSGLTSFPLINTASCNSFASTWRNCTALTSFPLINTSSGVSFYRTWRLCTSLTSFPLIDTSSGIDFTNTWLQCSSLTSFPLIDTSQGTTFSETWFGCSGLTSFPLLDTSSGTNFAGAWRSCTSLTSFPSINTAAGTNFSSAWYNCSGLTSFPAINTSSGTNFGLAWALCAGLTSFPSLNFDSAEGSPSDSSSVYTGFRGAWSTCTSLSTFPANLFDNATCTRYQDAFTSCALTAQSIENILVSINAANTSNGNLGIAGGTNAAKTTWSTAANNAYDALILRGWTITYNA